MTSHAKNKKYSHHFSKWFGIALICFSLAGCFPINKGRAWSTIPTGHNIFDYVSIAGKLTVLPLPFVLYSYDAGKTFELRFWIDKLCGDEYKEIDSIAYQIYSKHDSLILSGTINTPPVDSTAKGIWSQNTRNGAISVIESGYLFKLSPKIKCDLNINYTLYYKDMANTPLTMTCTQKINFYKPPIGLM